MKKVSIVGWYGHKNIGDESFREVFTRQLGHYDLSFGERPDLSADAIILGGGGVVCKKYLDGLESYRKPIYAVGVDISVNGEEWQRIKSLPFRFLFIRSFEYWQIASKEASNVCYCPDIAFSLFEKKEKRDVKKPTGRIGVILSADISKYEHLRCHISNALKELSNKYNEIVYITMCNDKASLDFKMNQDVFEKTNHGHQILMTPDSVSETLEVISSLDVLITMRFHGAIFATICGVPFLSVANKGKCSLFCDQEGILDSYIELSDINEFKILNRVFRVDNYRYAGKLKDISKENAELIDQMFDYIRFNLDLS